MTPRTIDQHVQARRVLMQTRPNAFTQRGGDTIVLERLSQGLAARGIEVCVDTNGERDPRDFDLVHLFNFATPALTWEFARRAIAAGVPYVVTTLYEDVPQFHAQSHVVAKKLVEYVAGGQRKDTWSLSMNDIASVPPVQRFAADEIARSAAALLPNGSGEARSLQRDFPFAARVREVPVGYELGAVSGPELFERTYGVRDFVFCVGRLESRKNQLMLLKALEDSELPVVLAAGGFSYQPEYEAAIRNFKRKGATIVLGRIESDMLASAYAACRVHVLPSWYELPGLVSLEAAAHGKNIVVTRTGTTADYVGDKAFYCAPWDEDSIRSAVTAAYYAPTPTGLVEMAKRYTWDRAVDSVVNVYNEVTKKSERSAHDVGRQSIVTQGVYDMSVNITEFQDALEQGELAAKNSEFVVADELLRKAEQLNPNSPRVLKARGAVLLAQLKHQEARVLFDRALGIDPADPKLLAGRGMCDLVAHNPQGAIGFFEQAVNAAPDYLVALYQLLECSYALGTFDSALRALERYLSVKPFDCDMRFCYAGCLYKCGQWDSAKTQLERILAENPAHPGATQLKAIMEAAKSQTDTQSQTASTSPVGPSPELRGALEDLSARVRSWKIGSEAAVVSATTAAGPVPTENFIMTAIGQVEDLKRAGEYAEAVRALARLKETKDIPEQYRETVECLDAEFTVLGGDLAGASAMYDAVLRRDPQSARALCGKGALAAEQQDWSSAKRYFDSAIAIKPSYDVALAGLGLCAMVGNRAEEAFMLFERAVQTNPENHRALLGVLQTGYPLKRYTQMERMLSAYLDLHPASIDMLYSFAGVLYAQGKVNEARLEIEKILIFEPEHEHALELRGMIDNPQGTQVVSE